MRLALTESFEEYVRDHDSRMQEEHSGDTPTPGTSVVAGDVWFVVGAKGKGNVNVYVFVFWVCVCVRGEGKFVVYGYVYVSVPCMYFCMLRLYP